MGKETLQFLSEAELRALGDVSKAARRASRPTPGVLFMAWLLAAAVIIPSLPALMLGAARLLELQALAGALGAVDAIRSSTYLFNGGSELVLRSLLVIALALAFALGHSVNLRAFALGQALVGYLMLTLALDLFVLGISAETSVSRATPLAVLVKGLLASAISVFTVRYRARFGSTAPQKSWFDLRAASRLLWGEAPVDRLFLLRLHLSCLIGAFYFFRLMFPETGIYDQAGLDPERAAGIVYARALWVPFWFLMLLATWKQRRGEQTTFWAYAIVTTLNLFFDIPYFFFSSPYGFNSQAFFALSARLLVVALAWSMVRNLPYLPLERRFFTLPIAPRGSLPSAPPKYPNAVN